MLSQCSETLTTGLVILLGINSPPAGYGPTDSNL